MLHRGSSWHEQCDRARCSSSMFGCTSHVLYNSQSLEALDKDELSTASSDSQDEVGLGRAANSNINGNAAMLATAGSRQENGTRTLILKYSIMESKTK